VVNGRQPQQLNAMTLMRKASQLPTDGLSSERCSAIDPKAASRPGSVPSWPKSIAGTVILLSH
ncbi:MAG TPA: hypothetical protein VGJ68_19580, partial [Bradyrhizobium sp.]